MAIEYVIHGHGSVQDPFGRLLLPFHAGKSTITYFTNYGSCATVNRNRMSIAAGMGANDPVHYIRKSANLKPRVVESRTGIPLFSQSGWVTDLWIDISPSNLAMAGVYKLQPNDHLQTVHITRHRQEVMLLSDIVHALGPAHFHVLTCRAAVHPIHHNNANILAFALNKNKISTSRRKRIYKSHLDHDIPASLEQMQTRKKRYLRK